jgi:hypothetical protein
MSGEPADATVTALALMCTKLKAQIIALADTNKDHGPDSAMQHSFELSSGGPGTALT